MTQSPSLPLALDGRGLEAAAKALCEASFQGWPDDSYNGRDQRRFYTRQAGSTIRAYLTAVPASQAVEWETHARRMEEALRPFAEVAIIDIDPPDHKPVKAKHINGLFFGHFKAARAAITDSPAPAKPDGAVNAELLAAAKRILPYLRWTISEESPGHHPTMPSAVAAFEAALSAPSPREGSEDAVEMKWRDLALQFDGHRIQALSWLRTAAEALEHAGADRVAADLKAFLAGPPLSGEQVLADRLAAAPSPQGQEGQNSDRNYATFHGYLDAEAAKGVIDFSLRVVCGPDGESDFYIHPTDHDGETGDFTVVGNVVLPIPDGHCAGSRPLAAPHGTEEAK